MLYKKNNNLYYLDKHFYVNNWVERGIKKALEHKGPVLIVSHGGVYWAVQEILELSIIDLDNG